MRPTRQWGLWVVQAVCVVFGSFCVVHLALAQSTIVESAFGWKDVASAFGAALAVLVGLWSKHQDSLITAAAKEAREAKEKALEVERELLRRYRPSVETTAAMEAALAPVKKEMHELKTEFVTMRTQFIAALLQLKGHNGKHAPTSIGEI